MKGEIKITVDGMRVTASGNILFENDIEPYFVLHSVAKCLDITTVEQFARLAVVSTFHKPSNSEVFEQTRIEVPRKYYKE